MTKTRRTFLDVGRGDEPVPGAKREQELKQEQTYKDARARMLSKLLETVGDDKALLDWRESVKNALDQRQEALEQKRTLLAK